ncbi:uncharacterized protein [Cicer arietinum]|uniref:uncharacterized protein n=1 Tax=Cicer arietinum TaxID=3827 RepID=UPI003CC538B4
MAWKQPHTVIEIRSFMGLAGYWKANVVVDALSRKRVHLTFVTMKGLKLLEKFCDLDLNLDSPLGKVQYGMIIIDSKLMNEIKVLQVTNMLTQEKRKLIEVSKAPEIEVGPDDILRCNGLVCIPENTKLRKTILDEAHKVKLSIHPGTTKMNKDVKQKFWLTGMKKHIANMWLHV